MYLMSSNPFLRPLPRVVPNAQASRMSSSFVPAPGDHRAQKLQSIVQDIHTRTARIQHVKAVGQQVQDDLKSQQHTGSSRLDWLAKQLKQKEF